MSVSHSWKSRPVFITSTFRDMHAERDYLHQFVFPELEERLKERFHHLEPIDLRWGVETRSTGDQQAKELLVLKVCLAEIERSRPFLIALIGDRYGWIPPPERMKAAVNEAGFTTTVEGKSITALEIEYGVLDNADQRRRSRFYFREPLPYDSMDAETAALCSDLHSGEPGAEDAHDRLQALKHRIAEKMPDRVRHYSATWDAEKKHVNGLEEWGKQVLEDLWSDLEVETRAFKGSKAATWQEQESLVLEQFVEMQSRGFVGREETIRRLHECALSPARQDTTWGICVSGPSGSGKSSLFARLCRDYSREDLVFLSHAAGISVNSTQVEMLLRRWTGELAIAIGIKDPSASLKQRDDLEKTFSEMLAEVASRRRVVCLIDALNQFERSTSAQYLTWLPQPWPMNARLICTAIPATETEVLAKRTGVTILPLPILNESETELIAETICKRYRKALPDDVRAQLATKKIADGSISAGIPLWLELAMEELLLLDADDFARAEREYIGNAEEKLHALLVDVAKALPPDVESLYSRLLERAEELHGKEWASGFVNLIALSRNGWREADVKRLLGEMNGREWSDLEFAALRRTLRAHVVQRGANAQWDFVHSQMRVAVERRSLHAAQNRRALHGRIANYLQSLPQGDSLRASETMFHVFGEGNSERGGKYMAGLANGTTEKVHASQTMAWAIEGGEQSGTGLAAVEWCLLCIGFPNLTSGEANAIANLFLFEIDEALSIAAKSEKARLDLLFGTQREIENWNSRLTNGDQISRALSVSYNKLGDLHLNLGDGGKAQEYYRKAMATVEELHSRNPHSADYARYLSVTYNTLGEFHQSCGDAEKALEYYRKAMVILKELHSRYPESAPYIRDLSVTCNKLGSLHGSLGDGAKALEYCRKAVAIDEDLHLREPQNTDYSANLGVCYERLGDFHLSLGNGREALQCYCRTRDLREELHSSNPQDANCVHALSVSYLKLGDLHLSLGDGGKALEYYRKALAIAEELKERNPHSAGYARTLSASYGKLGDLHRSLGDGGKALECYRKALAIAEVLKERNPQSADYARDLGVSYDRLGDLQLGLGNSEKALAYFREALEMRQKLHLRSPAITDYAHGLWVSHSKLGDLQRHLGDWRKGLDHYLKALTIAEELHSRNLQSADFSRDLGVSLERLGDLYLSFREEGKAMEYFRKSLAIAEDLVKRNPQSADYARDLWVSYCKMAAVLEQMGDGEDRAFWTKAYDGILEMKRKGILLPTDEQYLEALEQKTSGAQ
jgi:tetratricopeptide (TPR) repeat protein